MKKKDSGTWQPRLLPAPETKAPLTAIEAGRPPKDTSVDLSSFATSRRVTIMEDHMLPFPELWMNVYVFGPMYEAHPFAKMFARAQCYKANTLDTADLVVFVGGDDVNPALYGEEPHMTTAFDIRRDEEDIALYLECIRRGIPMVGVCRGAQFLHVMNGGTLYQDVDNHFGPHTMWDMKNKMMLERVSSVHHQMCRPRWIDGKFGPTSLAPDGFEKIGCSHNATERYGGKEPNGKPCTITGQLPDIEAFFYRHSCCFGVQGHPEYAGYDFFTTWFLKMIDNLINENSDLEYRKETEDGHGVLRMREELMKKWNPVKLCPAFVAEPIKTKKTQGKKK